MQPWITPSLFDNTSNPAIVDEWTFGLYQDRGSAQAILTQHWNTWITESDFQEIAAAGCVLGCAQCAACGISESNRVVPILDSITCAFRLGIGPLMCNPENHTSQDNKPTSFRPSLGHRHTILRLSSISTVPPEVKTGTNRTCLPILSSILTTFFNILASITQVKSCRPPSGSRIKPISTARMQS